MSIADNVRKAALNKATENAPQGNQTAAAATQIATSATGKGQSAAEGQALSNVGERLAMGQAQAQQNALTQQQLNQAAEISNQETAATAEQQAAEQNLAHQEYQMDLQRADELDGLLSTIKQSEMRLEDRADAIQVENAAQKMRLSNKEYMHNLDIAAKRENLNNAAAFKKKAMEINMSNGLKNVSQQLKSREDLASMDIQSKLKAALSNIANATKILEDDYRGASGSQNFAMGIELAKNVAAEDWDMGTGQDPFIENAAPAPTFSESAEKFSPDVSGGFEFQEPKTGPRR